MLVMAVRHEAVLSFFLRWRLSGTSFGFRAVSGIVGSAGRKHCGVAFGIGWLLNALCCWTAGMATGLGHWIGCSLPQTCFVPLSSVRLGLEPSVAQHPVLDATLLAAWVAWAAWDKDTTQACRRP